MNRLKCTVEKVFSVNCSDLEKYIFEITGKLIEIPCILECSNDTSHRIEVGKHPEWVDDEDKEEFEKFLFGENTEFPKYGSFNDMMEVLCMHGKLEKGVYIIDVSW